MTAEMLQLAYLSVACGAASLVVSKGAVFDRAHKWLEPRAPLLEQMLSCPWCLSHWVALALVLVSRPLPLTGLLPVDYFVATMVVVALSSLTARAIFWAYSAMGD